MEFVEFTVYGEPKAKARPQFTRSGHAYTKKDTVLYENLVRLSYIEQVGEYVFPAEVPLAVSVICFFSIPKSTPKRMLDDMRSERVFRTKKPDLDNVVKSVTDGLLGVAYLDDSQICNLVATKRYSANPRVEVVITQLT
jgi:Holliday junction resolvase RusA-like endonuclease